MSYVVLLLSVLVRLMFALKAKGSQIGKDFTLKQYFDSRHLIRWGGHLLTAFTLSLFIPSLVIDYIAPEYFPKVTEWTLAGDFILGFAGYDLVKLAEKVTRSRVEKITGQKFDNE